jgi:BASS family bile acid:Na+ symporter
MSAEGMTVFALGVALFASALTLGFKATLAEPFFLFRHPGLLIRTFVAMYVVVPMVTVAVLGLVPLPLGVKIGLVLLAISSTETTAPKEMLALGGNPPYVFSLLITMSLVAVITVPLSLAILTALPLAADARVPPLQVAKVVALTFLVPLAAGAFLRRLAPRFAERIDKPLSAAAGYARPVILLSLFALNFSGVWDIGLPSFLVIAGLSVAALAVGHWLGGPNLGDRASLAIAAGSRETGIAALIAALNFPAAKSTMVIIVIYEITTSLATLPYEKWCKARMAAEPLGPGKEAYEVTDGRKQSTGRNS